jgi:hypothetical protein
LIKFPAYPQKVSVKDQNRRSVRGTARKYRDYNDPKKQRFHPGLVI